MAAVDSLEEMGIKNKIIEIIAASDGKFTSITIKGKHVGNEEHLVTNRREPRFKIYFDISGLGKDWCRHAIENMLGGQILYKSELGKSVQIDINLPEKLETNPKAV